MASSAYAYDPAGRLTSLAYAHGGATIDSYQLSYDAADRMVSKTDRDNRRIDYTYDAINRETMTLPAPSLA